MNLTKYLRARLKLPKKYTLRVIGGSAPPYGHHEDAGRVDRCTGKKTKYAKSGGRWNTYVRAVNEIRVGRDWILAHVEGWKKDMELSDRQVADCDLRWGCEKAQVSAASRLQHWHPKTPAERWAEACLEDRRAPQAVRAGWTYRKRGDDLYPVRYDPPSAAESHAEGIWILNNDRGDMYHLWLAEVKPAAGLIGPWEITALGALRSYHPYGDRRDADLFMSLENATKRSLIFAACGIAMIERGELILEVIHEDDFGTLLATINCSPTGLRQERVVKVVNSTPDPDGTYRDYFLRVPPDMTTARQAVAWTFGLPPERYAPATQS